MSARILLVDDHQVLREGLRALLEKQEGMEVVGEAGDGHTALQLVRDLQPDVVIMDVNMPGMDGIDATRLIVQEHPMTKVLPLSMYLRKTFVSEMLKSGAFGYILKEDGFSEIVKALRAVIAGERYVCSKVANLLVDEYIDRGAPASADNALTERETTVIQMLANGKTSKEIAAAMNASAKTIDACRRQVMRKLELTSVAELVKYAIREGLTGLDS